MRKGQLYCSGSSLFLKNKFGIGYTLTLSVNSAESNPERVYDLIKSHVSQAETLSQSGNEHSFRLPLEQSQNFAGLLQDLEIYRKNGGAEFGIREYGLSLTSLEEVFLRTAEEEEKEEKEGKEGKKEKEEKAAVKKIDVEQGHGNIDDQQEIQKLAEVGAYKRKENWEVSLCLT